MVNNEAMTLGSQCLCNLGEDFSHFLWIGPELVTLIFGVHLLNSFKVFNIYVISLDGRV